MAGYFYLPEAEPEGSAVSPAVIVELAPVPVAPASPDDLAPGPDMLEAQPTPKPPEQTEPEIVEPVPKIEAPAEVTLPLPVPKAAEKKPEENPDTQKAETKPVQQQTPAPRTTAAPRSETSTAAAPAAPVPRQRRKPCCYRELARPCGRTVAAEQALSGHRRGAA